MHNFHRQIIGSRLGKSFPVPYLDDLFRRKITFEKNRSNGYLWEIIISVIVHASLSYSRFVYLIPPRTTGKHAFQRFFGHIAIPGIPSGCSDFIKGVDLWSRDITRLMVIKRYERLIYRSSDVTLIMIFRGGLRTWCYFTNHGNFHTDIISWVFLK